MKVYQSAGDKNIWAISPIKHIRREAEGRAGEGRRSSSPPSSLWLLPALLCSPLLWCKHSPLLSVSPRDLTLTVSQVRRELRKFLSLLSLLDPELISLSHPQLVMTIKSGEKMIWEVRGRQAWTDWDWDCPPTPTWQPGLQLMGPRSCLGMYGVMECQGVTLRSLTTQPTAYWLLLAGTQSHCGCRSVCAACFVD